jgi:heme oxygenase
MRMAHDTARAALRTATAPDHERVDAAFSRAVLSDRVSYGHFLRAQAAAHLPVEDALVRGGIAALVPDWDARRRDRLLQDDLHALGLDAPAPVGDPVLKGDAALLGALYVLEGSRLGGTMLKRSVAPDLPTGFLGAMDSAAWRELLALLDARLDTGPERAAAIAAARAVFTLFETGARLHLG